MIDDLVPDAYCRDLDENVRPERHAAHLRPYTAVYEVIVPVALPVIAPSKARARELAEARIAAADFDESIEAEDVEYRIVRVDPGATDPVRDGGMLKTCPAYVWFQARRDDGFHAELAAMTTQLMRDLQVAPAPLDLEPPAPQPAKRLRLYRVAFRLTFRCRRTVWAVDDDDAAGEADEDVRALLSEDAIDLWTDDQFEADLSAHSVKRVEA